MFNRAYAGFMSFEQWLIVALACIGGAVSPGPSLAVVIRHASHSRMSGLLCSWSHALGVGFYAAIAATGLAILLDQNHWLDALLSLVAATWLARLAILSWREAGSQAADGSSGRSALRDGISMGLMNPKVALFFMALFTAAMPGDADGFAKALAVLTAILIDGGWYSVVTLALQHSWAKPALQQHASHLARISAVILALFAAWLLLRLLLAA